MSLLDDLKKEVDERSAMERKEAERIRSLHEIYHDEIRPRMHDAYHYFMEFFNYLEQIEADSGVQMELPGYEKDMNLRAAPHFVRTDKSDEIGSLECGRRVRGEDLHLNVIGNRKFASQTRYLDMMGLDYTKSDWCGDDGRVIGGKADVKMNFVQNLRFKVDHSTATVDVSMTNFRRFGMLRKQLKPEELSKENFDLMGLYILGRSDSVFLPEQTVQVSAESRRKLQEKLAEDKRAKEEEIEKLRAEKQKEKDAHEQQAGGILGIASKFKKDS